MKKISEMSDDEVRDYALSLEKEKQSFTEKEEGYKKQIEEVTELNKSLQKRNNDLFMQVEQQVTGDPNKQSDPPVPDEEKTETCEDFARRLVEGGKK